MPLADFRAKVPGFGKPPLPPSGRVRVRDIAAIGLLMSRAAVPSSDRAVQRLGRPATIGKEAGVRAVGQFFHVGHAVEAATLLLDEGGLAGAGRTADDRQAARRWPQLVEMVRRAASGSVLNRRFDRTAGQAEPLNVSIDVLAAHGERNDVAFATLFRETSIFEAA